MGVRVPNLDRVKADWPLLGEALEALADLHDNTAQKLSINPQGKTLAPPPHAALNVSAANGIMHVTVDNGKNPRTRQLHNFVEYDTDPGFKNAQVESLHVGTQRRIPTFLGKTVYLRSYTMYADGEQQSPYKYAQIHDGATMIGPHLPPTTGSGTSSVPGRGFGIEHFVSEPTTPGKPPKVFR